ncbi:TetR/AcrR family transcriptional regulator [Streptomyces caatingaensis]|uniref:TetR family transcriptional regulator n=1 Tax=Streptomyces caatingaensis TaxID=1678637 RepID=A0A0K9XJY3_9ACTN|nr:TetR/AcrR family transcriptional regulator [Streptomyces caatingaensis]KNB53401.1 TetR family transcriptional regulator [Streptomyces caatingaensis]
MARPKGFDPDRVLDAAMHAFWSKGYAATSAQDLVDGTGLGRGSLYNAYASKHGLFVEALRRYDEEWATRQVAVLEGEGAVREKVRAVLMTVVDEESAPAGDRRGCLAVNAAVELAGRDEEVTAVVRRTFRRMEDAFCEALQRARGRGEIGADRDARALARYLLNSMYGLRVLGRTADRAVMTDIVETVLRSLSSPS